MKMLHLSCLRNVPIWVSGLFFILFACELAHAMETGTFAPPILDGYSLIEKKYLGNEDFWLPQFLSGPASLPDTKR